MTLEQGTQVDWYADGHFEGFTPLEDKPLSPGLVARAHEKLLFHRNGAIKYLVLARDWKSPALDLTLLGRSEAHDRARIEFYENGDLKAAAFLEETHYGDGVLHLKAGSDISFWEDNSLKSGWLAGPYTDENGETMNAGNLARCPRGKYRLDRPQAVIGTK